jgi:hypothetical protein
MAEPVSRRDALKAGAVTVIAVVTTRVHRDRRATTRKPVCTALPVISNQSPKVGVPVTVARGTWA